MSTTCPICGSSAATLLFQRPPDNDPGGRVFSILRCGTCRVEWLDPFPTEEELDTAYGSGYYERHSPDEGAAGRLRRMAWDLEIRPLKSRLKQGVRVLEVGCGTGELLAIMRRRHGAVVQGIERSEDAIAACKAKGIPVHAGSLGDVPVEEHGVDVIIMRHVLEHVPSPRDLLARAHSLLAPGGALLLTVPVTGGWDQRAFKDRWEGYRIPEHLLHFPSEVVESLLNDAGFKVGMERHSIVPNPWVNAVQLRLKRAGREKAARFVTLRNPLALALALPLSATASVARRSGRLTILAVARP